MTQGWFVTGTDTGIGKTHVAALLLEGLKATGITALGMKPVATGGFKQGERLVNDDALLLRAASSFAVPYELLNPYVYATPVSPHLAAAEVGETIDLGRVLDAFHALCEQAAQVVVEGAGGWLVPLNEHQTMEDLARLMGLPVVLVVGMRLGCINHALLSHRAIQASGVQFAGWVANHIDPAWLDTVGVIATLTRTLGPPLAVLDHGAGARQVLDPASFLGN